jgi:hypothetical protein
MTNQKKSSDETAQRQFGDKCCQSSNEVTCARLLKKLIKAERVKEVVL